MGVKGEVLNGCGRVQGIGRRGARVAWRMVVEEERAVTHNAAYNESLWQAERLLMFTWNHLLNKEMLSHDPRAKSQRLSSAPHISVGTEGVNKGKFSS